jgi:hypothetical protein
VLAHRLLYARVKTRVRPSVEMLGLFSLDALFTFDPKFTGSPHVSFIVARVATQISLEPFPPVRVELKYNERPSAEMSGRQVSPSSVTIVGLPQGASLDGRLHTRVYGSSFDAK